MQLAFVVDCASGPRSQTSSLAKPLRRSGIGRLCAEVVLGAGAREGLEWHFIYFEPDAELTKQHMFLALTVLHRFFPRCAARTNDRRARETKVQCAIVSSHLYSGLPLLVAVAAAKLASVRTGRRGFAASARYEFPGMSPGMIVVCCFGVWSYQGEGQMNRFRRSAVAGALITLVAIASACTSTSQRDPNLPLNSACALGFDNDRPCSY